MSFLLTPDEIIMINNFCNMYSNNIRLIESLNRSNDEIRNSINAIIQHHNVDANYSTNNNRNHRNNVNNRFPRNQYLHEYIDSNSTRNRNNINQRTNTNYHYMNPNIHQNRNHNRNINRNLTNNVINATTESILQTFFEPIVIFPTQTQIENATRIATYGDIVNPINNSCPISLERFNDEDQVIIIRYCGHIFNIDELQEWFRHRVKCPVCRYDIRNYVSDANLNNEATTNIQMNTTNENNSIRENDNERIPFVNQEIPIRRLDLSNNVISTDILTNLGLTPTFLREIFDIENTNGYYLDPSSNTFLFTMTRYI